MKKAILTGILAGFCACLFALDAEVIGLNGKAQISTNGTSWSPIAVGNRIPQGAIIQTGFKSELKLKVKGSEITLDPMTRITIDELSEKDNRDNTVVSMKIGGLTSNVKKVEDRRAGFTVKGPAATASVRGTILSEEVGYNRDTVKAIENTTMVWPSSANGDGEGDSANSAARAIAPGQKSSVDSNGGQSSPQSLASQDANLAGAAASAAAMEAVASSGQSSGDQSFSAASGGSQGNGSSGGGSVAPATGTLVITVGLGD